MPFYNMTDYEKLIAQAMQLGTKIFKGANQPSDVLGDDGDVYIDTGTKSIYGPKTNGSWGDPTIVQTTVNSGDTVVIQGPVGPQGDPGQQGPVGPKGNKGDTGDQGLTGATGPQGEIGPIGLKGDKGDTGATGNNGAQGISGPQGAKGDTGSKGDQGIQGLTGQTGPAGNDGNVGPTGPQGIQGLKGDTGVQGPQGIKGDTGATGATGAQGVKGDTGATGPQGPAGTTKNLVLDRTAIALPVIALGATANVVVTWNKTFPDTSYSVLIVLPAVLLGKVTATVLTKTTTTATIQVSAGLLAVSTGNAVDVTGLYYN